MSVARTTSTGLATAVLACAALLGLFAATASAIDEPDPSQSCADDPRYVGEHRGTFHTPDETLAIYSASLGEAGDGSMCGVLWTMRTQPDAYAWLIHYANLIEDGQSLELELHMEWWDFTDVRGTLVGIENPDGSATFDGTLHDIATGDPIYTFEDFTLTPV